jgi:hypothetical protein
VYKLTVGMLAPLLLLPAVLAAGDKDVPPPLVEEHWNESHTLSFRTPAGWSVSHGTVQGLQLTEARGDGYVFRLLWREGGFGLDALHVECMMVRLASEMETELHVDYEYDFVGGEVGARRVLDSAFVVEYNPPIDGEKKWRQRNLTVVGDKESVCLVTYAPNGVYKKSKAARKLLTSLVESVKWP